MSTTTRSPRRRPSRPALGLVLGVVALAAAACSSGAASSTTTSTPSTTSTTAAGPVVVHTASLGTLGTVLVNASGLTLYRYTPDGTGKSVCTGTCAKAWPPLTVPTGTTHPRGGPGIDGSLLGTIVRSDGSLQVTFKGVPLYTFAGDTKAGEATGQGLEGTWYVVTPASATPAPTGASTTTTGASAGGYNY